MRIFWSLVLALVVVTAGLSLARVNGVFASETSSASKIELPAWRGELVRETEAVTEAAASVTASAQSAETAESMEVASTPAGVDPEVVERLRARARGLTVEEGAVEEEEVDAGPAYTLGDDGTLTIEFEGGPVTLRGDGSASSPYVLPWEVLRGVQRVYSPREGKRDLPAWLDALEGAHVSVQGNTLVPLVSSMTTEILVMQNPWDGCCIGVPPTPYDAIEVKLDRGVTFSNSATGFGRVVGVFEVDPYEVSGWLMGLFLINDAAYASGEGVELPGL